MIEEFIAAISSDHREEHQMIEEFIAAMSSDHRMTEEMIPYPPAPPRLEDEDPELGELIAWYSNLDPIQRKRMGGLDTIIADKTVGRNDPCPCGRLKPNGKPFKYKNCCSER